MKKLLVLLALPVLSTLAFAQVDTSKPMVTGKGNVTATLPGRVLITNQTQTKTTTPPTAEKPVELTKFEVTGSLLRPAAKPAATASR
jgi:hypothetical protein